MNSRLGGGPDEFASSQAIENIIMSPISPWEENLKDMVMIGEGGTVDPTFLPNFIDAKGKAIIKSLFRTLRHSDLPYDGITHVVPIMYKIIADSKPIIKFEGSIYDHGDGQIKVKMAVVSDGLAIFHLNGDKSNIYVVVEKSQTTENDPSTLIHEVAISTEGNIRSTQTIPFGSSFIVWNAHHAARTFFKVNFKRLVELHNPVAIDLIEVRMYEHSFIRLEESMETGMEWGDESVGLTGEVAVMWDKTRVKGKTLVSGIVLDETTVLATIKD